MQGLRGGLAVAALTAILAPCGAAAYDWSRGDLTLRFDSLLSVGVNLRAQDPDCEQIATVNGGCNPFATLAALRASGAQLDAALAAEGTLLNQDDGNLNWDQWDVFSILFKGTHDLQADFRNYGAFVRFNWFADAIQVDPHATRRTNLDQNARHRDDVLKGGVVGAHFQLLDAYLDGGWAVGDRYLSARVGNQVINWGESLFQQGGLNSINTLDVTKIRLPGSELKEALQPAPILKLGGDIVRNLGFELYYQLGWRRFELDPVGSFFAASDLVSRGAEAQFNPLPGALAPGCGDSGTPDEDRPAPAAVLGCTSPFDLHVLTRFPLGIPFLGFEGADDQGQFGAGLRYYADRIETELAVYFIRLHHKFPIVEFAGSRASLADCGAAVSTPAADCDLGYRVVYPEDVDLAGVSFNTLWAGIAFGAELSYRWDQPTPVTFNNELCNADNLGACTAGRPDRLADQGSLIDSLGLRAGPVPSGGGRVPGFVRLERLVAVANALYIFSSGTPYVGPLAAWLGADDVTAIVELAVTHYRDLDQCPSGRVTRGCRRYPTPFGEDQVDDTGWGYTLRLAATYDRVLGTPIAFLPAVSFAHDAQGITPPSEAGFNEDVMALGVSLEFVYQQRWSGILSYSSSFGGGIRNADADRDFLGLSVGYQF